MKMLIATFIIFASGFLQDEIPLTKRTVLKGQISILVPESFSIMSREVLKVKYPGDQQPDLVFTNKTSTINLNFEQTEYAASLEELALYQEQFVRSFEANYPSAKWLNKGIKEINGKQVGFLEIQTPAVDTEIYNLMFYTNVNGVLMIISFNSTLPLMDEWQPIAHKIMQSMVVNE